MAVTDKEVEVAIAGLGFGAVAGAMTEGRAISPTDLRTDMRGALEAFLAYASTGDCSVE